MNGAASAAVRGGPARPLGQTRDEGGRYGTAAGAFVNGVAAERPGDEAAPDRRVDTGAANGAPTSDRAPDRLAAAAAAASIPVPPPPMPADPVAAALERLRRNRADMVRALASARPPRRRGGGAGRLPDRWSLVRTVGAGAVEATARQHPLVAVGAALVAGAMLARLVGRRSIVRSVLVVPLLSRVVAPMVMRMASDAALRMVRGGTERGDADRGAPYRAADRGAVSRGASGGMPRPP